MLDRSAFRDPEFAHGLPDRPWALMVTALFFVTVALGMLHHEPWRDELQAWMIARDSGSVPELIRNMRYEGHPAGWHLLLFALSRVTRNPAAMQALHLLIATASSYLVLRFAPMPRLHRGLLVFGYFFAFEYAVISRSYALGVLALFAFCTFFPLRARHPILIFVTLGVLAMTSVYGTILSLTAGAVLLVDAVVSARPLASGATRRWWLIGVSLWLVSAGGAIAQVIPPADATYVGEPAKVSAGRGVWELGTTVARVWTTYVPIPDVRQANTWSTHLFAPTTRAGLASQVVLSLLLIVFALLRFGRRPLVLLLYLTGTAALLLFTYVLHAGYLRHDGHLFLLFVASLWLAGYRLPEWHGGGLVGWVGPLRAYGVLVTMLLLVQCTAAVIMYAENLRRPFSNGRNAAEFLRAHQFEDLPIAGSHGPEVSTVSGLLDRPIYHLAIGQHATFVRWNAAARPALVLPSDQLMARLVPFLHASGPKAIVLLGYPYDDWGPAVIATRLASFTDGIERTEHHHIYLVRLAASGPLD